MSDNKASEATAAADVNAIEVAATETPAAEASTSPAASTSAKPAADEATAIDVAAMTPEERRLYATDLFGRGSRNFLCREYPDAADELSEVCTLYEEIYGPKAEQLGMPYLLYAKTLVRLAQDGENKVLADVPEQQESEDEEEEGGEEEGGEGGEAEANKEPAAGSSSAPVAGSSTAEAGPSTSNGATTNGSSSNGAADGADDTIGHGAGEEEEDDDSPAANLQVAWEVLELAVQIFEAQGEAGKSNLADAYFELAEISLENSHFTTAVRDYNNSLAIQMKLPDNNLRAIAEIEYKIGLGQMMLNNFDEAVTSFRKAVSVLDAEIANKTEAADGATSEELTKAIATLENLKVDVALKIAEVEEAKQQSMAEVKEELAKLMAQKAAAGGSSSGGSSSAAAPVSSGSAALAAAAAASSAGGSSAGGSSTSGAAKPMDISHLVKRKKPTEETTAAVAAAVSAVDAEVEETPAKKMAL